MRAIRTVAFVDGFNLYHAVRDLGRSELKWLDLRRLLLAFAPAPQYDLDRVLYFTAFATWKKAEWARHRAYVEALRASGVEVVLSVFKQKPRRCPSCGFSWNSHEEKETDVSIACQLVDLAYRGGYDRALVVSGDSDLTPAVALVRARFPTKQVKILTPPGRPSTGGLVKASGQPASKIRRIHVERSLLPRQVLDTAGTVVAVRPVEYDPAP